MGFLFPVIGLGKTKPKHMNPYHDNAPPADPGERHPITLLSNLYLEIGLPLHEAAQSAIADFEQIFDGAEAGLCAR